MGKAKSVRKTLNLPADVARAIAGQRAAMSRALGAPVSFSAAAAALIRTAIARRRSDKDAAGDVAGDGGRPR